MVKFQFISDVYYIYITVYVYFTYSSELPVNGDLKPQKTNGALTEPPPLPKSGPPGKAMSLQSDGQSADEDYLESHIHLSK